MDCRNYDKSNFADQVQVSFMKKGIKHIPSNVDATE